MKRGFTLAEILITLGIIGVVSAITMPILLTNIQDKIRQQRIINIKYKFTKATEKMNTLGLIGPYENTEAFVNELEKHLKIIKRCDVNNLKNCWPYEEIELSDGSKYNINDAKTGMDFKKQGDGWNTNNVGIVTADGTPMILSYKTDCEQLDSAKSYPWTTYDGKPVTNATTECVAMIFEVDGKKGANKFKKDAVAFGANGIGTDCTIIAGGAGRCLSAPTKTSAITLNECQEQAETLGINPDNCVNNDYWAGAVKSCGGFQYMINAEDVHALTKDLYGKTNQYATADYNYKSNTALEMGITPPFYLWTAHDRTTYAHVLSCQPGSYYYGYTGTGNQRFRNSQYTMCVLK